MFEWLKLHFIPSPANHHRPHILHQKNVNRIIGFVMFVEVFAFLVPSLLLIGNADNGQVLPSVLSDLTNQQRIAQNLPPLTVNPLLNEAAQEKADDMAQNSYFAHVSPAGKTPWYWLSQVGYTYSFAGENLAVNFTDSKDVTSAWMNSPTHRANILKANYTQVGTGVASGTYEGNPTIFVAQDFGTPADVAPLADASASSSASGTSPSSSATAASNGNEKVLGAETASKGTSTTVPKPVPAAAVVSPASVVTPVAVTPLAVKTAPLAQPTYFQRLLASPRNTANTILFVILGIVALAVFLNIGIKISQHHPDLILNGVMVMAIIGCVFVMNSYISKGNNAMIQTEDFTAAHTVI